MRTLRYVAVVALLAALAGCGDDTSVDPGPAADGRWTAGADTPLSPRYGALMAWTGDEMLVLGGHSATPCPPNADCAIPDDGLSDGAAYDLEADTWRPIAAAPVEVDRFTGHVLVDGDLVVGDDRGWWWSLDPDEDTWTRLPAAPRRVGPPESTYDGSVYARDRRSGVVALDLSSGTWRALPTDPLEPRLTDSTVFATDQGILVSGVNYQEAAADEPTLTQVDVWDGRAWSRLPRTGMIGPLTSWTGLRLIGAEPGGADGGEVNGWDRWYPSAGAVDPATGRWEPLADVPGYAGTEETWYAEAAGGTRVATGGYAYEDTTQRWTLLGRPGSDVDDAQAAAWAGDRLVFSGGFDTDAGESSQETWIWSQP